MDRENWYLSTIDERAGEVARKYGLGVEIAEYCTAWNMDEALPRVDAQVRKTISGIPRRILHAPFNELHPCAIDPKARQLARSRYARAVELARDYGCRKVVIHGGFLPNVYYPDWYVQESVTFWRDFLEQVPQDLQIVLENVLEDTPQMQLGIVRAVDDPRLRLCLDVGHAHVYSGIPVTDWLEAWGPWISHFHIHNNAGAWDSHCPLGQGTIPIGELLARSRTLCPEASYTLELTDAQPSVRLLLEE